MGGATSGAGGLTGGAGGTGGVLCASSPSDCEVLRDSLIHRYSFDGAGITVTDSVGAADGVVIGAAELSGQGELELAGGDSGQYVDLPNELIRTLENATLEAWLVWNGGGPSQRVFDFGDALLDSCALGGQEAPEGQPGACGRTYLNLMVSTDSSLEGSMAAAFLRQPGVHPNDRVVLVGPATPTNVEIHVAVVVDDSEDQWRLYFDGALQATDTFVDHLSDVHDINNWLGRSQFVDDATRSFKGTYLEFRIYDAALTDSEVETSFSEGPDAPFLD